MDFQYFDPRAYLVCWQYVTNLTNSQVITKFSQFEGTFDHEFGKIATFFNYALFLVIPRNECENNTS